MADLSLLAGAAGTALLQRTFLIQTQTATGVPKLLVVLDTVNEESPEFTADVTQHPVESGPEVSDHIQLKNPTLTLRGKISNTPLDLSVSIGNVLAGGIAAITDSQARSNLLNTGLSQSASVLGGALQGKVSNPLAAGVAGAMDAISRTILLAAYTNKTPFNVVTKRQTYESMVIQSLKFPRTKDTGYALEFEMDMIQLRIVSPLTVQLTQLDEKVISSATPNTNLGGQTSKAVSDQATDSVNKSWLRGIVTGGKG